MYDRPQTEEERNAERIKAFERTKQALESYKRFLVGKFGPDVKIGFVNTPEYADSDFMVFVGGKLDHFLEAKVRYTTKDKYQSAKIPLRKHSTAEHWMNAGKIKSYFLCIWQDQMGLFDLTIEPDIVDDMVARFDRGTERDVYAFYKVDKVEVIPE